MGSLVLPVKNLLAEPQLLTDQWLHLDGALPESQVLLRAELKVSHGCSSIFRDTRTIVFIAFPVDSRFQNGGSDQLWDSALCCPRLGIREWSGEVDAFILAAGETADGRRPRLQVCPQMNCMLPSVNQWTVMAVSCSPVWKWIIKQAETVNVTVCGTQWCLESRSYFKDSRCVVLCRGLLPDSKDGVDSYVSLLLLPDKSKNTKKKTAVKKRDHNPEYNER